MVISNENLKINYRKLALGFGITLNILTLCYYKYAGFFIEVLDGLTGLNLSIGKVFLPLAISFFTLQQVSFLIDAYHGEARKLIFSLMQLR